MKLNYKLLILCIAIPLFSGALSSFIAQNSMTTFDLLNKPPLTPPGIIFPIIWSILYILMGIASYLVLTSGENANEISIALTAYGLQLIVNILWPVFFFSFQWYFFSFLWLVLLWVLVAKLILEFGEISKVAAGLNVPYLLWLSFAGYLNLGIWLLN